MSRFNPGDHVRIVPPIVRCSGNGQVTKSAASGRVLARYEHTGKVERLDEYLIELPSSSSIRLSRFQLRPASKKAVVSATGR